MTTEDVSKIFPNLNVVTNLIVPASWGSCLLRLAILSPAGQKPGLGDYEIPFVHVCVHACVHLSHFYINLYISLIYKDIFTKFAENFTAVNLYL